MANNLTDWNYSLGGYTDNLYHLEVIGQGSETRIINIRKSDKLGEVIFVMPGYQKSFKTTQINELLQSLGLSLL